MLLKRKNRGMIIFCVNDVFFSFGFLKLLLSVYILYYYKKERKRKKRKKEC